MERLARSALPQGFGYAWSGISFEEVQAAGQSAAIFGIAILLVYLTLAAQYESLVLPVIVLLGVPLAVLGALSAQWARGLQNDLYCQIGLVMLIAAGADFAPSLTGYRRGNPGSEAVESEPGLGATVRSLGHK